MKKEELQVETLVQSVESLSTQDRYQLWKELDERFDEMGYDAPGDDCLIEKFKHCKKQNEELKEENEELQEKITCLEGRLS